MELLSNVLVLFMANASAARAITRSPPDTGVPVSVVGLAPEPPGAAFELALPEPDADPDPVVPELLPAVPDPPDEQAASVMAATATTAVISRVVVRMGSTISRRACASAAARGARTAVVHPAENVGNERYNTCPPCTRSSDNFFTRSAG
jgi:hypothetical protein